MAFLILRLVLILGMLSPTAGPLRAQSPAMVEEYSLKSVFILNFCRFITWPQNAFSSPSAPLVIGMLGEDPFGGLLESAIRNETTGGRPIRIERYSRITQVGNPQLLFIGRDAMENMDVIVANTRGRGILLVGEGESFLRRGGMIAFVVQNNRVGLSINQERVRSANLSVSSKLLRVAR